jgi:hypothetical protein
VTRTRNLPPDPERENDTRARQANAAVAAFQAVSCVDDEEPMGDLLCNLMHLCDREPRLRRFNKALDKAFGHYRKETAADGGYAAIR